MYYKDILNAIEETLEVGQAGYSIDPIIHAIQQAKCIFLAGAGRSGLVAKMFGMRLMHLNKKPVYVVGDVITPAITEGDTLMIISGSGRTKTLLNYAMAAEAKGASLIVFTSGVASPLADMSCHTGAGPNSALFHIDTGISSSITPLGSLFELSTLILLESVIARYMDICGITTEEMQRIHANLE